MVNATGEDLAVSCAHAADERKGENITVLQVGEMCALTDYFVIVTGRNARHLRALRMTMEERLEELENGVSRTEGEPDAGWVLVDAGSVVVHLFDAEKRDLYDLEMLWGDCPRIDWSARRPQESGREE